MQVVVDAVQAQLGLPDQALELSRSTLRRIGNCSAPTVLYMLDEACRREEAASGDLRLLIAMGPGFTEEVNLLRW